MGYDMRWLHTPPEVTEQVKAVRARFDAACNARDALPKDTPERTAAQELVHDTYYEMQRLDVSYFRLNISGMGEARDELLPVEVVIEADRGMPPKPEDFGLSDYPNVRWDDDLAGWTTDDDANQPVNPIGQQRAYLEAIREWRDGLLPGDTHGIPLYKFGSNDGWLVAPAEIRTGIAWADHHHPGWRDTLKDYVLEFVVWMELAAKAGGFRVW